MNYELAKQLEDTWFPQEKGTGFALIPQQDGTIKEIPWCQYVYRSERNQEGVVYAPSLEELIEACGDDFESVGRVPHPETKKLLHWRAYSINLSSKPTHGQTPEEAVAKLWLELNKK
jgi:hypothetical protein